MSLRKRLLAIPFFHHQLLCKPINADYMRQPGFPVSAPSDRFEDFQQLAQFLDRWYADITFTRKSIQLHRALPLIAEYNTIDEMVGDIQLLINAMDDMGPVALQEIVVRADFEDNLDYFLTDAKGLAVTVESAWERLYSAFQYIVTRMVEIEVEDREQAIYYQLKATTLLNGLARTLKTLVIVSDAMRKLS